MFLQYFTTYLQPCCNIILEDTKAEWKPLHCVHFRISQDALLARANPKHDEHHHDRDDANADMDMVVREGLLAVRILVKILASSNFSVYARIQYVYMRLCSQAFKFEMCDPIMNMCSFQRRSIQNMMNSTMINFFVIFS